MPKKIFLFFLLSTAIQSFSQTDRTNLLGIVKSDSLSVEAIHVLNKNSGKGTITNSYGHFKILIKENDTLIFSGVQFYYREVLVTKKVINEKTITVNLLQKINELEEVEVKTHNLLGNLTTDAGNLKDSSKIQVSALDFSMIDFSKPVTSDIDDIDRKKPPDISHLVDPTAGSGVTVGIPLNKLQTKEEKKLKSLKQKTDIIDDIKYFITEKYFVETLKIPQEEIDDFIEYCKPKGIVDLFIKGKKIEVIDILIIESKSYKN